MSTDHEKLRAAWRRHERRWADNRYVYAVVSRRSRGVSVGINLNPGKECNFGCIYCQVDRSVAPTTRKVDLDLLKGELHRLLEAERDGSLYDAMPYSALSRAARGVRDIAFSGDGEPTTYARFKDAVDAAADARRRFDLESTKVVLITDSAYLTRPAVREALAVMDANNGEIWAKLDAGTEEYFRVIDRPNVPLQVVLDNILATARVRPIVVQTLFLRVNDEGPPPAEVEAYCRRLNDILCAGGRLKAVQLHTIARRPAEAIAAPLTDAELDALADIVTARVPVHVERFYGVGP